MSSAIPAGSEAPVPDLDSPKAQQILEGARALFNERGYEGASMSLIAARAGVSKGTLYNYFPDKQALFAAHVRAMCHAQAEQTFNLDPNAPDLRAALEALCSRYLRLTTLPDALATFRIVVAEAPRFKELGRIFLEQAPRRGMGKIAAWLAELDRQGRLRVPEPEIAAWQLMMLARGLPVYEHMMAQRDRLDDAEVARMARAATDIFLKAYAAAPAGSP